jgi:hypothetical protein
MRKDENGQWKPKKGTPDELAFLAARQRGPFGSAAREIIPFPVLLLMYVTAPVTCSIIDPDGDGEVD